jgi:hypothetical protein
MTVTLLENQYTFLIISRSILLTPRNVSEKIAQKISILCSITFILNRSVHVIMWKNIVQLSQMTIRHMRIACWKLTVPQIIYKVHIYTQNT